MKLLNYTFIVTICSYLLGCASGATSENMVFLGEQKEYSEDIQKNLDIGTVSGGKKTNPLWVSKIDNQAFHIAVKKSLKRQGLYSDSGRYRLEVKMLKVDQPFMGFDMKVTTHVRYILTDTVNETTLLDETVITPYTATVSDAFMGLKRMRLANEGSVKKNIEGLLDKLSQLNIGSTGISITN